MTRRSAHAELSRAMFARDSSESPTIRMVRDGISREDAYDVPRDLLRPTRLAWRGAFTRLARQQVTSERPAKAAAQDNARRAPFVAPPWRFADWSFAVLAGFAGLLTALAVFVLIGTRGGHSDIVTGSALRTSHTARTNAEAPPAQANDTAAAASDEGGPEQAALAPPTCPADVAEAPSSEAKMEATSERALENGKKPTERSSAERRVRREARRRPPRE
jgi:hypothetical protein